MGLYSFVRSLRWKLIGYPADQYKRLLNASERWSRAELVEYRNEKTEKANLTLLSKRTVLPTSHAGSAVDATRYKSRERPRKTSYLDQEHNPHTG